MTCIVQSLASKNTVVDWFVLFGNESTNIRPNFWGYSHNCIHPIYQPWRYKKKSPILCFVLLWTA